ncbi:hypothetical protein PHMEG_00021594 [Phytophthora megakarya]|uniref:Tyr recombinase domain-containing protein n=1 Tax=Phytophthora megakarya TaxID=4795 RepID=A0A225VMQ4_9STRA|nr:hypothetical protein PHMEG_00021594 [Phytophthora megakarya]
MTEPFDQALWGRSENVQNGGGKFKWFAVRTRDVIVLDEAGQATLQPRLAHAASTPTVFGVLVLLKARRNLPADIPAAVYMKRNRQPACISTADVAEAIKRAAAKTGQDPWGFRSHSLRSGGATHMYRVGNGCTHDSVSRPLGSDVFKVYNRVCKESAATLSSDMVAGSMGIRRCVSRANSMTNSGGSPRPISD